MIYKTLNIKPETMKRFRFIGNRSESDDEVLNGLIDLHNETIEDLKTLDQA